MSATAGATTTRGVGRRHRALAAFEPATVFVALLTAAVFVLRATQLGQALWGDEVLALHEITGHTLLGTIRTVRAGVESSPPLFFVLAWLSAKLGDPTIWIRLPTLIFGTATIPLTYLVGRETVGRTGGALGAAIFALTPFSTYYGVEARPYATLAFCVVCSTLALLMAVRTGARRWWILYAIGAAAAAYTHYTAVFALGVQAVWSLWACRDRLREPLLANLLAALLYAPWLPQVHGSLLSIYALLEPLTTGHVLRDIVQVIVGYPYAPLTAIPTVAGLVVCGACALAGLIAFVRGRVRGAAATAADRDRVILIVALAAATPVGLFLYSKFGTEIWSSRSLYASAPALALVFGGLLAAIPGRAQVVAAVAVLGVLVFGTIRAISPRWSRPQFRAAAQFLDRSAGPRDPVVLYPSFLSLTNAVPALLEHPHRVLHGTRWPSVTAGGSVYIVRDDAMARALHIPTPHPAGFALRYEHHYGGLLNFTVLGYRATR